jgi:hypothetical protein
MNQERRNNQVEDLRILKVIRSCEYAGSQKRHALGRQECCAMGCITRIRGQIQYMWQLDSLNPKYLGSDFSSFSDKRLVSTFTHTKNGSLIKQHNFVVIDKP